MIHNFIRAASFVLVLGMITAAFSLGNETTNLTLNQNANSATTMPQDNQNSNRSTRGRARRVQTNRSAEVEDTESVNEPTEQTDLSGTYTGTFNCPDAGIDGETTLTITGTSFTTSDGKSGRISAATTRGYTGVAMQFGELKLATARESGSAPVIVSMRARKAGNRLTLTTIPGAGRICSFTPKG